MKNEKVPKQPEVVIRTMPEFHTLFGRPMSVFGKDHGNPSCRTVAGLSGFYSKSGHFIDRAWGSMGSALCGATVSFTDDPVVVPGTGQEEQRPAMAACCRNRILRFRRRLEKARLQERRCCRKVRHAKEPWVVEPEEWTEGKGIAICSPRSDAIVAVIDPGEKADVVDLANAHRIVACVNACEGIPRKGLKKGEVKKLVAAYSRLWAAVENGIEPVFFSLREEYRKLMAVFDPPNGLGVNEDAVKLPARNARAAGKAPVGVGKNATTGSPARGRGGE